MRAAIELVDLVYSYPRGNFSLNCPVLRFPLGQVTLITGPNGSGKTTLSKLMCGILRPKQGELRIFGEGANTWSLGKIGRRVGYLFQEPSHQLFATTVWKEMIFVPELLGGDKTATAEKSEELLQRFDLLHLKDRSVHRLSRGEKQRLALCTILMGGADFLILDEPTSGLDKDNRLRLYALLSDLAAQGKGLAVITHEGELIARYRDNFRLEQGRLLS